MRALTHPGASTTVSFPIKAKENVNDSDSRTSRPRRPGPAAGGPRNPHLQSLVAVLLVAGLGRRLPPGRDDLSRRQPDGDRPQRHKPIRDAKVDFTGDDGKPASEGPRDVLVLPEKAAPGPHEAGATGRELPPPVAPYLHMARSKNFGVLYATVLLFVIVVSNVSLRGLWSVAIILVVVIVILVLALFDKLAYILDRLYYLDMHINLGGYLFISLVLFIIWALTVFVFDRRTYVIVTPGQGTRCMAVGGGKRCTTPPA